MKTLSNIYHSKGFKWMLLSFAFIAVGVALNQIVVRLNGGMPVMGLDEPIGKWIPMTLATKASILGDILFVGNIQFSLGDILAYMGLPIYLFGFALWFIDRRKEQRWTLSEQG